MSSETVEVPRQLVRAMRDRGRHTERERPEGGSDCACEMHGRKHDQLWTCSVFCSREGESTTHRMVTSEVRIQWLVWGSSGGLRQPLGGVTIYHSVRKCKDRLGAIIDVQRVLIFTDSDTALLQRLAASETREPQTS